MSNKGLTTPISPANEQIEKNNVSLFCPKIKRQIKPMATVTPSTTHLIGAKTVSSKNNKWTNDNTPIKPVANILN